MDLYIADMHSFINSYVR